MGRSKYGNVGCMVHVYVSHQYPATIIPLAGWCLELVATGVSCAERKTPAAPTVSCLDGLLFRQ